MAGYDGQSWRIIQDHDFKNGTSHHRVPAGKLAVAYTTLNESSHIVPVFRYLDAIGCRARLFVDSRTDPKEVDVFRESGVDFVFVDNEHGYVEGIYGKIAGMCDEEWVLILNGDEIPTRSMLDATRRLIERVDDTINCLSFPRRWVRWSHRGELQQSFAPFIGDDYQYRIIRHRNVVFRPVIHTCGFDLDYRHVRLLPREYPIYHFDWIVHSKPLREKKLSYYNKVLPGAGAQFAKWYLPEDCLPEHHMQSVLDQDVIDFASSFGRADDVGWVDQLWAKSTYPRA